MRAYNPGEKRGKEWFATWMNPCTLYNKEWECKFSLLMRFPSAFWKPVVHS